MIQFDTSLIYKMTLLPIEKLYKLTYLSIYMVVLRMLPPIYYQNLFISFLPFLNKSIVQATDQWLKSSQRQYIQIKRAGSSLTMVGTKLFGGFKLVLSALPRNV